jgi:hypothetical protein
MPAQNHSPRHHSSKYSADSACVQCGGVIRHELWCSTQCTDVRYAYDAVVQPNHLNLRDRLILHALGVTWLTEER